MRLGLLFCLAMALAGQTPQPPSFSAYVRVPGAVAPYPYKWMFVDPPLNIKFDAAGSPHIMTAYAQVENVLLSTMKMAPNADNTVQAYTYVAQKTPAPNTIIFVMFRSSALGEDYFTAILPAAVKPKEIVISVKGVPHQLTDGDNVTLAYWSIEQ